MRGKVRGKNERKERRKSEGKSDRKGEGKIVRGKVKEVREM